MARLDLAAKALSSSRSQIDRSFFAMGEELTGCVRLLMEIALAQKSIPAELSSPEFLSAGKALEIIRERGMQLAAEQGDKDDLRLLSQAITALGDPLATLRRAISTIQLIAVNAKIVAAGLARNRPGFGAFATDMLDLGREASSEIEAFAKSYDHLLSCLKAAMQSAMAFRQRHGGTMIKVTERIEEHLATIAHHRARAEGKALIYEEASRLATARISGAVAAVQIGDISRQRIEHVELILDRLCTFSTDPERAVREDNSGTMALLSQLGCTQISAAAQDFEREIRELVTALRQLGADTAVMLRDNANETERLLSAGGTALGAVVNDMQEIDLLLRDFGEMRAGLAIVAGEVARSVDIMVAHLDTVRKIEQEIHLLSLNTAVQCNQLGHDGRALLVIAQDLRMLASETAGAARLIMSGLGAAQLQTKALIEDGHLNFGEGTEGIGGLTAQVVDQLRAVTQRLQQHVGVVIKTGPEAARLLDSAAGSAERHRNAASEWRRVERSIASLFPPAAPNAAIDAESIRELRAHYTMDSERVVHDRIAGPASSDESSEAAPVSATNIDFVIF